LGNYYLNSGKRFLSRFPNKILFLFNLLIYNDLTSPLVI
jgi:hypothetical protein